MPGQPIPTLANTPLMPQSAIIHELECHCATCDRFHKCPTFGLMFSVDWGQGGVLRLPEQIEQLHLAVREGMGQPKRMLDKLCRVQPTIVILPS